MADYIPGKRIDNSAAYLPQAMQESEDKLNAYRDQFGMNTQSTRSGNAAGVISSIAELIGSLGGAVGDIITSIGRRRALENSTYNLTSNQGGIANNVAIIAVVGVAAVVLLLKK